MAKASTTKTGSSKIRFIMLEADLSEGDLSQVTLAIQNALRPSHFTPRLSQTNSRGMTAIDVEPANDADERVENEEIVVEPRKPRVSRPRSVRPPKVIDNIDWDSATALRPFVEDFDLKSDFERYLVVSLWFKDHRQTPSISASHVYTAFRHMGWSTTIPDFLKPFRNMRESQLFAGNATEGFAINQLGEGKIKAKKRG